MLGHCGDVRNSGKVSRDGPGNSCLDKDAVTHLSHMVAAAARTRLNPIVNLLCFVVELIVSDLL